MEILNQAMIADGRTTTTPYHTHVACHKVKRFILVHECRAQSNSTQSTKYKGTEYKVTETTRERKITQQQEKIVSGQVTLS